MKPIIIFFARDYQAELFPKLNSTMYDSVLVTYNKKEKKKIEKNGFKCHECFEEIFDILTIKEPPNKYLETSFSSDRYFGKLPIEKRILILQKYIAFWKYVYEKYNPLAVINEVIAVEVSEVMYIEAKKRNIAYLAWLVSPFKERQFYWLSNPFHASLNREIFQKEPNQRSIDKIQNYIGKLRNDSSSQPFYVQDLKKRSRIDIIGKLLFRYLQSILVKTFTKSRSDIFYFDHSKYIKIQIKSFINSLYKNYDDIKLYRNYELVFYPLHYEPEASLTYFAEFFDDQINTIKNLTKCLKNRQILIVKEHPQQPGILLTKQFQNLRKSYSNILYLPAEYPTKELLRVVEFVITISSTAGWEAMMFNKPVFVFGKVFYDKYPLLNICKSFEDLKNKIQNDNFKYPNFEETLKYAANFFEYCQEGNPFPHKDLYNIKNIEKILNSIETKIGELLSITSCS